MIMHFEGRLLIVNMLLLKIGFLNAIIIAPWYQSKPLNVKPLNVKPST